ncbi:cation-translocating P-type ATPase [Bacillus sp. E214]|uniref:cation-translocating P-type ATPase n=1 Tax=Bacillus sp. E214 TaxID=2587156 RepID=UPI0021CD0C7D|nr:cation-translocating P-type ATPase [Bacillus sp. E214]
MQVMKMDVKKYDYSLSKKEVLKVFETDAERGITEKEAEARLKDYGKNEFGVEQKNSLLKMIALQIHNTLNYILMVAALFSFIVGEVSDGLIITFVIIINTIIGVVQEKKAENALDELKKLAAPKALVKREGNVREIDASLLVPGDCVLLEAGRTVPADIRIIQSHSLKIEESALTGESLPVDKDENWNLENPDQPLGDYLNMAFMSTQVTNGRGIGIVAATGLNTEVGKIAEMLHSTESSKTPLQKNLDQLGKKLSYCAIIVCVVMFIVGLMQGRNPGEMFMISTSLAVSAIPESLSTMVIIVLTLGVRRLIKQKAIIRRIPAVETLGSVSMICSDKTGTLTLNKMSVVERYVNLKVIEEDVPYSADDQRLINQLALCSDATYEPEETGDPTEVAFVKAAHVNGYTKSDLDKEFPRVAEIPFDSTRKRMTTIHKDGDGYIVLTKGAVDILLERITTIQLDSEIVKMTQEYITEINQAVMQMSNRALRVMALAGKRVSAEAISELNEEEIENGLTFFGMVGLMDPPRPEAKLQIERAHRSGIEVTMITGDHPQTAIAIAHRLGITESDKVITGAELNQMTPEELKEAAVDTRVFARVSPEHKVQIVQAFKENGHIVSMTGDGVNDAPSLKTADIGVAMGQTGTDVAKGASDMVLMDDNFTTIIKAVEEGRNIFANIRKSVLFLVTSNFGEVLVLFFAILLGWPTPLLTVHILWLNLVGDSIPAFALGVDKNKDVMLDKPRPKKEGIFTRDSVIFLILNGLLIGVASLLAFLIGLKWAAGIDSIFDLQFNQLTDHELRVGQTVAFMALTFISYMQVYNVRHLRKPIWKTDVFSNKYLNWSVIGVILLQLAVVYIEPFAKLLKIEPIGLREWILIFFCTIGTIVVNEIVKGFLRYYEKRKAMD